MASMGVMAQMFCDAGDSGTQFTPATPPHPGLDGGFCSIRSLPSACRRRVAPLMVQFPPFTGGEAAVRGGEAAVRGYVAPHSANHLGHKRRQRGVVGEIACVVSTTAPNLAYRSHMNH